MSQGVNANLSSRERALARRKALSTTGKAALKSSGSAAPTRPVRTGGGARSENGAAAPVSKVSSRPAAAKRVSTPPVVAGSGAKAASLARRKAMSQGGKAAIESHDRSRAEVVKQELSQQQKASSEKQSSEGDCGCGCKGERKRESKVDSRRSTVKGKGHRPSARANNLRRPIGDTGSAKVAALARRKALSARGKAGLNGGPVSEAQAARASNPRLSGRELARVVREQRSRRGSAGQRKSTPTGRQRKAKDVHAAGAQDAPWKVGASETVSGQVVTGTMVGRKPQVSGDEAGTCRSITGTEYMGADIFRQFCQDEPAPSTAKKVVVTSTSHGTLVSGDRTGRALNVTGNEPGICKNVTGNEYLSAEQTQMYCGEFASKSPRKVTVAETMKGKTVTGDNISRSDRVTGDEYGARRALTGTQYSKPEAEGNAPNKVGVSTTLRGGSVTGTVVARNEQVTGNEPGTCRNVTGDEYLGQEEYQRFCGDVPPPQDSKVEVSETFGGRTVTGSLAQRSSHVTGNEPGTCKAVTGTPYAGTDEISQFCAPKQQAEVQARNESPARSWGRPLTGQQPGVGGAMTGADKGACEAVSGTPYVGADQAAEVCPAAPAEPGNSDFPQALGQVPGSGFSVEAPSHASQQEARASQVTGSSYEKGKITGPFGMADDKVTGTEQARFGQGGTVARENVIPPTAESVHGRVKSRITGEGMDAGQKITGDDWDRGDRVTGTEGMSATRRNPTLRGGSVMGAAAMRPAMQRPEETPEPVSRVTGASGNTEKGSLITYSGGARG